MSESTAQIELQKAVQKLTEVGQTAMSDAEEFHQKDLARQRNMLKLLALYGEVLVAAMATLPPSLAFTQMLGAIDPIANPNLITELKRCITARNYLDSITGPRLEAIKALVATDVFSKLRLAPVADGVELPMPASVMP